MARSRTLSNLRSDAYKWADLENFTNRYPASEVTRYVNQGISELWDMLVAARGYAYYGKPYIVLPSLTKSGGSGGDGAVAISGVPVLGTRTTYQFYLEITTTGAIGVGAFKWSADGGSTFQQTGVVTAASVALQNSDGTPSGLTVTFAGGVTDDATYTATAAAPTTTSGQLTYALPTDFYKLHKVWLTDGPLTTYAPLERVAPYEEPMLRSESGLPRFIEIHDGYYDLFPEPSGSYTINMLYVPRAAELVNDTDAFDGINGWEDYVAGYAARRMALKEGDVEVVNLIQQDLNKLTARIEKLGADRDSGTPKKVQDVRGVLSWTSIRQRRGRYFPRA